MKLAQELRWLNGVGPSRAALLARLGIGLVGELLLHLPRAWLDRRTVVPISSARIGDTLTVAGRVVGVNHRRTGRGGQIVEAVVSDGTPLRLVFFSDRYPANRLQQGMQLVISGTVENFRGFAMVHPDLLFPPVGGEPEAPGMQPLYPLTSGLSQGVLRRIISAALDSLDPPPPILPAEMLSRAGFADRLALLRGAHNPAGPEEAAKARDLLALEEICLYRWALELVRAGVRSEPSIGLSEGPADPRRVRLDASLAAHRRPGEGYW